MLTLHPEFALALLIGVLSLAGVFFAVKFGGAETQRLVIALHRRFDAFEQEMRSAVTDVKILGARHDERITALKESQRFRLPKQDMFRQDEGHE